MMVVDSSDKSGTFKIAFLTAASIFVMGYLNALALNTYDLGTMITPQTGNVILMGLNFASGYWVPFFENLGLFFGFMGGAVFALYTQNKFESKTVQFYYNWTVFIAPIILYPLVLMYVAPPWVSYAALGFSAGATLGFFRKMYHLEINSSMATGNVRFLGLHFAQAFFKKDTKGNPKEVLAFWVFFICVLAFAGGAALYAVLAMLDTSLTTDVYIGLGRYEGFQRLSLGRGYYLGIEGDLTHRLAASTNISRIIGLLAICIVPYFFCPKFPPKQA